MTSEDSPVLDIEGLTVVADTPTGDVTIVDDVSLKLYENEVLCVVGESGSGKSVTMLAVAGLLAPELRITKGSARLRGINLADMSQSALRAYRGKDIGFVFQDPMTSLNPVKRVGAQIARAIRVHQNVSRTAAMKRAIELLEQVGVPDAAGRARSYPHQWSGGMRQRAMIAIATANSPDVLIADEPTTALDVTVQKQVMAQLARSRETTGASMVMITHDLGLVAEVADRVAIMYSGRIVELGTVWEIFDSPRHPYTRGLLGSLLTADTVGGRAVAIDGSPPSPSQRPSGCAFEPRCTNPNKSSVCKLEPPVLTDSGGDRAVACHHAELFDLERTAR